ncbi:MAG: NERD domain-containing protein [Lysobacteraceae bacterium]|nr:MAG: NERD domain-containing protein [Xanthomonadaceae bacterium]
MLIKKPDDLSPVLASLEGLATCPGPEAKRAAVELRNRKAGLRAERESAYLIDHDFAASKNWAVIHDLRLEHGGRVAQIDHVLINRWLQVYVLETKGFHDGVKINEEGEFLRWNNFAKRYEGMPSPLAQNDRHIDVLRGVFNTIELPTRLGLRMSPEFMSFVLVSPDAQIKRPHTFDASRVIKADQLKKAIWRDVDGESALVGLLKTAAKFISSETVQFIARELAGKHRPLVRDLATPAEAQAAPPTLLPPANQTPNRGNAPAPAGRPSCKACHAKGGAILYGKYGYYFKCSACGTNTAIRPTCMLGHQPRLRKEKDRFFRECAECGSSELIHTNPPEQL